MNIYLITSNKDKVREAEAILNAKIKNVDLDLDEIQELDPKRVADHKAKQAWAKVKKPVFVWDLSIYISCLNGFPGPLIKWFWSKVTLKKICNIANHFRDHKIMAEAILTFYDGKRIQHFSGRVHGTIPNKPRGTKGWGWDAIFIPKGYKQTYAEMRPQDVVHIRCHRVALEKLRDFLKK